MKANARSQSSDETTVEDPLSEGPVSVGDRGANPALDVREQEYELLAIAFGPLVWVVHFLASYLTNAIYCAKYADASGDASVVRWSILVFTVIAIAAISGIGWFSYRKHRHQNATVPHDEDTPEDRYRFLGFAGYLLSLLSIVAVIFTGLVAVFVTTCD